MHNVLLYFIAKSLSTSISKHSEGIRCTNFYQLHKQGDSERIGAVDYSFTNQINNDAQFHFTTINKFGKQKQKKLFKNIIYSS